MPSDYRREYEDEVLPRSIKCHFDPSVIIDIANSHGVRCEKIEMPSWDFCVVRVWATKRDFKRCQYEWLARMIAEPSATEIEL